MAKVELLKQQNENGKYTNIKTRTGDIRAGAIRSPELVPLTSGVDDSSAQGPTLLL
jgi:hypothetical protein